MQKIQTQGVHHITFVGADRQTSIDFWEGVLGMPMIFEQPNLDAPAQNHLYFDPGDGRLITVFTNENRKPDPAHNPEGIGNLQHIAFTVSRATYTQAKSRLDERGIKNTGEVDRGFMYSIYFRDPLGQLIELACYKFDPPVGVTHAEVLLEAHLLRTSQNDYNITDAHLADAIEILTRRTTRSLSDDRTPKDPYARVRNDKDRSDHHIEEVNRG
ncbi:MAG: VOC family protein [Ardenticatenaceae bacterium]|nr:VOC family protein [Ardenticatenaceae bacterium]